MSEARKVICSNSKTCENCKEKGDINNEGNNMIYFKFGHVYHKGCRAIEEGKYTCYTCRIEKMDNSAYTDIHKFTQKKNENNIKKDNLNEIKKKKKKGKKSKKEVDN